MSSTAPSPLGSLAALPPEIRYEIYEQVLRAYPRGFVGTFGQGSGIDIALLLLSKAITREARPVLYAAQDMTIDWLCNPGPRRCSVQPGSERSPPDAALRRVQRLHIRLQYSTSNRGDYEESLPYATSMIAWARSFLLRMYHGNEWREVHLEISNCNQRKRGAKLLRGDDVTDSMRKVLEPFSFFQSNVRMRVGGFDALAYVEMFDRLRAKNQGKDLPLSAWESEILEVTNIWQIHHPSTDGFVLRSTR